MKTSTDVIVSREELYRRIWERPIRDVAADLGISDVGLKKVCRRNGIPTPPQGYHLMKEGVAKKRLEIALPSPTGRQSPNLVFNVPNKALTVAQENATAHARKMMAAEPGPLGTEQRRAVDAVLDQLRRMVDRRRTDRRGMVVMPESGYPVRVSPESFDRALRILNSLLSRFACFGAVPSSTREHGQLNVGFKLEGFDFSFAFEEASKRVDVPPPPPPKRPRVGEPTLGFIPEWRMQPTGRLTLKAWGPGSGGYKSIPDRTDRIEDRLTDLVEWVFTQVALAKEEARIESERWNRAVAYLQEKDKPRLEAEFQAQRRRQLELEARQWRRAQALRDYIAAVEKTGPESSRATQGSEPHFRTWLAWANSYIDSLDPIAQGQAGTTPAYPGPKVYERIPSVFLDYDDPAEADRVLQKEPWRKY
jgi:hypothetical protein